MEEHMVLTTLRPQPLWLYQLFFLTMNEIKYGMNWMTENMKLHEAGEELEN